MPQRRTRPAPAGRGAVESAACPGLAQRYRHRGESLDDLTQVAILALVKAVDGYDPGRDTSFAGYACPTILGELKRHFRDRVWSIHLPRKLQEQCLEVSRTRGELTQRLRRSPSTGEIADAMGISEAAVRTTAASTSAYRADSLNRQVGSEEGGCERQGLLPAQEDGFDQLHDRLALQTALRQLAPRARYAVDRYFLGNLTQAQIAEELGTSQMSVSRLLGQSLTQLRAGLADQPAASDDVPASQATVHISTARPGCVVATVRGGLDEASAAQLRDALVDVAVNRCPRMLVVDLRRVARLGQGLVRGLRDAYRACGHTGSRMCVVNASAPVYRLLCRTGLARLVSCRPVSSASISPQTVHATRSSAPARTADTGSAPATPPAGDAAARRACPAHSRPGHRRPRPAAPTSSPGRPVGASARGSSPAKSAAAPPSSAWAAVAGTMSAATRAWRCPPSRAGSPVNTEQPAGRHTVRCRPCRSSRRRRPDFRSQPRAAVMRSLLAPGGHRAKPRVVGGLGTSLDAVQQARSPSTHGSHRSDFRRYAAGRGRGGHPRVGRNTMMTNRKLYSVRLAAAVGLLVVPLTLGACDDDNDVATPPVATAEASPELDDITDDYFGDASYIGKRVTVQGTVTKVIPPASFVLAGREYGDDALLVVSAPKMDVQVAQQVDVTGVVRQFDYETYADDYDLGTDAGLYIEFEQEEVLIAGGPAGSATSSPAS